MERKLSAKGRRRGWIKMLIEVMLVGALFVLILAAGEAAAALLEAIV